MEQLLKPQLITKATGSRQIAAFISAAGAVLQLVAILLLPMYTLKVNLFGVKNSQNFTLWTMATDYKLLKGGVAIILLLVMLAVLQGGCAALTMPLPAAVLALVNVILCPGLGSLDVQLDYYFLGTAHNGFGRYVLVLGLLVQVAAVALTLMDKIGASGTNFAAAGRPTAGAVTGAAPVNPTPAAPVKTAFKAPAAPAALSNGVTITIAGKNLRFNVG